MLNFFVGLAVGVCGMWLVNRAAHKWYMGQIDGLVRYVSGLQQQLWDAKYEDLQPKPIKNYVRIDPH